MKDKIIEDFTKNRIKYKSLQEKCISLISFLLEKKSIKYHKIEARIKDEESLSKKIESKIEKYNTITDITDITGIRIITYFEDDVDRVAECLKKEFNLDQHNSVDKRWANNPNVFGYASLHQVLSISDSRKNLPEYEELNDLKFEVQIRSILQHAWAEIEHDIGYKNPISIPGHLTRSFSRVAGLLELADLEFKRIREDIEKYTKTVKTSISDEEYNLPINNVTLKEFLLKSEVAQRLNIKILHLLNPKVDMVYLEAPLDSTVDKMRILSIESIHQLDEYLIEKENSIYEFANSWFEKRGLKGTYENIHGIPLDISCFYLSFLILGERNDEKLSRELVSSFLNEDEVEKIISELNQVFQEL